MTSETLPTKSLKAVEDSTSILSNILPRKKIQHIQKRDENLWMRVNLGKHVVKRLESYKLSVTGDSQSTNSAQMKKLRIAVSKAKMTQKFDLNFSSCDKITEAGFVHLSKTLKQIKSPKELFLNFLFCRQITDKDFGSLSEGLKNLTFLQNLSLNLTGCYLMTDQGLNSLKEGLSKLLSLEKLNIVFGYCFSISNEGVHSLFEIIKRLPYLQCLSLGFSKYLLTGRFF